jgi:hypothetical protein
MSPHDYSPDPGMFEETFSRKSTLVITVSAAVGH